MKKGKRYFPGKKDNGEIKLIKEAIAAVQKENLKYSSEVYGNEHQNTYLTTQVENE